MGIRTPFRSSCCPLDKQKARQRLRYRAHLPSSAGTELLEHSRRGQYPLWQDPFIICLLYLHPGAQARAEREISPPILLFPPPAGGDQPHRLLQGPCYPPELVPARWPTPLNAGCLNPEDQSCSPTTALPHATPSPA